MCTFNVEDCCGYINHNYYGNIWILQWIKGNGMNYVQLVQNGIVAWNWSPRSWRIFELECEL